MRQAKSGNSSVLQSGCPACVRSARSGVGDAGVSFSVRSPERIHEPYSVSESQKHFRYSTCSSPYTSSFKAMAFLQARQTPGMKDSRWMES